MAVAVGTVNSDLAFTTTTQVNVNFTVASGQNLALVICLVVDNNSQTPTMIWDNGNTNQGPNQIGAFDAITAAGVMLFLYALRAPTAGVGLLLTVNFQSASSGYVSAISFSGVDQSSDAAAFNNYVTNNGNSSTGTLTVNTASGNATVEVGASTITTGNTTNQTRWWKDSSGGSNSGWASYALSSGTSTSFSEALSSGPGTWAENGMNISAAQVPNVVALSDLGYAIPPDKLYRSHSSFYEFITPSSTGPHPMGQIVT